MPEGRTTEDLVEFQVEIHNRWVDLCDAGDEMFGKIQKDPIFQKPAMQGHLQMIKQLLDGMFQIEDGMDQFGDALAEHKCNQGATQRVNTVAARKEMDQHPPSQPKVRSASSSTGFSESKKRRKRKQALNAYWRQQNAQWSQGHH